MENKEMKMPEYKTMPPTVIQAIKLMTFYCFQAYVLYDDSVRVLIPKDRTELDYESDPNNIILKINPLS